MLKTRGKEKVLPMQRDYNYVFYNAGGDFIEPIFANMQRSEGCRVLERAFQGNGFLQRLFFLHWSNRINRKIRLPFKRLWYRRMYGKPFANEKPTCFVFCGGKYALDDLKFLEYIKKQDPRNKTVILYLDLISKKPYRNFQAIKDSVDLMVTYDAGEAKRYGIEYYRGSYYAPIVSVDEPQTFETDVFFLGHAKDRLQDILNVHQRLVESGLRCDFHVAGVEPKQRVLREGLVYLDRPMPYRASLERLKKSRCVLELIQGGSMAVTLRFHEAWAYHRKLLTNCRSVQEHPLYDARLMQVFETADRICTEFLKTPIPYEVFGGKDAAVSALLADELDGMWKEERP